MIQGLQMGAPATLLPNLIHIEHSLKRPFDLAEGAKSADGQKIDIAAHVEAPLSWRDHEFQVRNPEGHVSEWVKFSYPFDDKRLLGTMYESAGEGRRLVAVSDHQGAIEPLRKAYVFADRILGVDVIETRELRCEWNAAIDNAALAKLRFRNGAHVRLIAGEHLGKSGTIRELGLRHLRPYLIDLSEGGAIWAADNEVELLTT
jgi:hypothetical protein